MLHILTTSTCMYADLERKKKIESTVVGRRPQDMSQSHLGCPATSHCSTLFKEVLDQSQYMSRPANTASLPAGTHDDVDDVGMSMHAQLC